MKDYAFPFKFQREPKSNRIFGDGILSGNLSVREETKRYVNIDLSSEIGIERTVFDLTSYSGFDLQMLGTKYMICIMASCVSSGYLPFKMREYYIIAAKKYSVQPKAVELAISRAIENINTSDLLRLNMVFDCEIFRRDNTTVSPGSFLSCVCARLVMLKSHLKGKPYFG